MRYLTAEQNAREEGRDCAIEWYGMRSTTEWFLEDWRGRCRSNVVRSFDRADCPLCSTGTTREQFHLLLKEWDAGFDQVVKLALGEPAERAAAVTAIAVRASALCSLLGVTNILKEENKLRNLRTCAHLAADVADDLAVFLADVEVEGADANNDGGLHAQ